MQAIRRGSFEGNSENVRPEPGPSPEFITQEDVKNKAIAADPYPWILHPLIDSLFCCGGALWLLLFVVLVGFRADMQSGWAGISLLLVNVLGQVFFADAHQPATLWRVYVSKRTRESVGTFVTVCGIIAFALGIAGLFSQSFTAGLVKVTLAWSIQHLLAQAFGVSLIYCYKRKYFM